MFDGPTTPGLDFDAPIVVLDLADVYSSEALAIFMACATAFMQATLTAHRNGAEGAAPKVISVVDEAWRVLSELGLGEWLQSSFKLARQHGQQNMIVMHRFSDLERRRRRRLARIAPRRGAARRMPARASSTARTRARRRWPRSCSGSPRPRAELLPALGRGEAIWKVGQRSFFVCHLHLRARGAARRHRRRHGPATPTRARHGECPARNRTRHPGSPKPPASSPSARSSADWASSGSGVASRDCCSAMAGRAASRSPTTPASPYRCRVISAIPEPRGPSRRARVLPGAVAFYAVLAAMLAATGGARRGAARERSSRGTVARARNRRRGRRVGRARATSDASSCEHLPRGASCWAGSPVAWSPPSSATRSSSSPPPNRARRPAWPCPPSLNGKARCWRARSRPTCCATPSPAAPALGEVKVFDPTAITGFPRAGWSPLGASHTWQAARETADRLVASAQPAHGSGEASFWNQAGARLPRPAALRRRQHPPHHGRRRQRWVDTDDQEQITNALGGELWEQPRTPDARDERAALETLDGIWRSDDRLRSSLVMTAALALKAYADPTVQECSREGELTANWLLDGTANTAYLSATVTDQARLRPIVRHPHRRDHQRGLRPLRPHRPTHRPAPAGRPG